MFRMQLLLFGLAAFGTLVSARHINGRPHGGERFPPRRNNGECIYESPDEVECDGTFMARVLMLIAGGSDCTEFRTLPCFDTPGYLGGDPFAGQFQVPSIYSPTTASQSEFDMLSSLLGGDGLDDFDYLTGPATESRIEPTRPRFNTFSRQPDRQASRPDRRNLASPDRSRQRQFQRPRFDRPQISERREQVSGNLFTSSAFDNEETAGLFGGRRRENGMSRLVPTQHRSNSIQSPPDRNHGTSVFDNEETAGLFGGRSGENGRSRLVPTQHRSNSIQSPPDNNRGPSDRLAQRMLQVTGNNPQNAARREQPRNTISTPLFEQDTADLHVGIRRVTDNNRFVPSQQRPTRNFRPPTRVVSQARDTNTDLSGRSSQRDFQGSRFVSLDSTRQEQRRNMFPTMVASGQKSTMVPNGGEMISVSNDIETRRMSHNVETAPVSNDKETAPAFDDDELTNLSDDEETPLVSNAEETTAISNGETVQVTNDEETAHASNDEETAQGSDNEEPTLVSNNEETKLVSNNEKTTAISNSETSHISNDNDKETTPGSDTGETVHAPNDEETTQGSDNEEPTLVSNNEETKLVSNNEKTTAISNSETAHISNDNDKETTPGSDNGETVHAPNDEETTQGSDNEEPTLVSNNEETKLVSNNEKTTAISNSETAHISNDKETTPGSDNGETVHAPNDEETTQGSDNEEPTLVSNNEETKLVSNNEKTTAISNSETAHISNDKETTPGSDNGETVHAPNDEETTQGSDNEEPTLVSNNEETKLVSNNEKTTAISNSETAHISNDKETTPGSDNGKTVHAPNDEETTQHSNDEDTAQGAVDEEMIIVSNNEDTTTISNGEITNVNTDETAHISNDGEMANLVAGIESGLNKLVPIQLGLHSSILPPNHPRKRPDDVIILIPKNSKQPRNSSPLSNDDGTTNSFTGIAGEINGGKDQDEIADLESTIDISTNLHIANMQNMFMSMLNGQEHNEGNVKLDNEIPDINRGIMQGEDDDSDSSIEENSSSEETGGNDEEEEEEENLGTLNEEETGRQEGNEGNEEEATVGKSGADDKQDGTKPSPRSSGFKLFWNSN